MKRAGAVEFTKDTRMMLISLIEERVNDDAENPFVLVYLRGAPHDWLRVGTRIGWTRLLENIRKQ
jgi:hypothetical protein